MQSIAAKTWAQRVRARVWSFLFHHSIASEEASAPAAEATAQNPAPAQATTGPRPEHGKKILIVDDNTIIIKTLAMKLKAAGYQIFSAEDGGTAVSLARKERPNLILLDISFPPDVAHGGGVAWDGFLIMDWLKRMDEAKDIPIIVISGGDPAKYKQRAMAKGAHSFFHKPIHHEELLATMRQIFESKTASATARTA